MKPLHYIGVLFCTFWFLATFSAWHDAEKNLSSVIQQRANDNVQLNRCNSDLRVSQQKNDFLQQQVGSLGISINSFQSAMNGQQQAVNSCVVSLGKMNPLINTKFAAWSFPIAAYGEGSAGSKHITYALEMVVTANHTSMPAGTLKCDKPFTPIDSPRIAAYISEIGSMQFTPAKAISDHEYEIRVTMMGIDWGPNRPIYFRVTSESQQLGACSFKPQQ